MKKLICVMLVAVMILTMCACTKKADNRLEAIKAAGKLTVATSPDFPPYEFLDLGNNNAVVGADMALAKYIADKLGVELEIKTMEFDAVKTAVTTNAVDLGIAGFSWTQDRADSMELSGFYNLGGEDGQGLLVRADEVDNFNSYADFSGKIVAVQNGSLQQSLASTQLPEDVELKPIGSLGDAVLMLTTGKVDAIAVDAANGTMFAGANDGIVMSNVYFDYSSQGNVMGAPKGETELIAAINEILEEVNAQGLYGIWKAEAIELANSLGLEVYDE